MNCLPLKIVIIGYPRLPPHVCDGLRRIAADGGLGTARRVAPFWRLALQGVWPPFTAFLNETACHLNRRLYCSKLNAMLLLSSFAAPLILRPTAMVRLCGSFGASIRR